MDGVLEPAVQRDEQPAPSNIQAVVPTTVPIKKAVVPLVEKATQPAMAMLGSLLPS
ncbi:MAG: hypothetical protein ACRDTD_07860 [Pseudonocardiaceae bacterium]